MSGSAQHLPWSDPNPERIASGEPPIVRNGKGRPVTRTAPRRNKRLLVLGAVPVLARKVKLGELLGEAERRAASSDLLEV